MLILILCGAEPAATRPASRPASQPAAFQPGIEIDWARREVHVKATVIMRQGAIELFACSPQAREHESIVRIEARPLHLYHALGLIGLSPGHPIRLDPETQKVEAATGDPLEIDVRYELNGRMRQEPIEQWMKPTEGDSPLEPLPWIFAGSNQAEGGGITAEPEGTVIALVDFSTALIGLSEQHSDRNEALWLAPATENIPPEGTRCTLVIRPGPIRIALEASGRLRVDGRSMTALDLSRVIKTRLQENPELKVRVRVHSDSSEIQQRGLQQLLINLGVPAQQISTTRPAAG